MGTSSSQPAGGGRRRMSAVLMCLSLLASCGGGGGTVAPTPPVTAPPERQVLTALTVSLSSTTVMLGQSVTASVSGIDQHGQTMTVGVPGWTSSAPGIVSISADGVVSARGVGQAAVVARSGSVSGESAIAVTPLPPGPRPVASVSVSPPSARLAAGDSMPLVALARDFAGNALDGRPVRWRSSDTAVVTVSVDGVLRAHQPGSAIVEATSEGQSGATAIDVSPALDSDIVVTIAIPVAKTVVGDTMTIEATVRSPQPIATVVANVGGQTVPLTFGPIGSGRASGWRVTMNLMTLPVGSYELLLIATDELDHRGAMSVSIEHNPKIAGGSKGPTSNK